MLTKKNETENEIENLTLNTCKKWNIVDKEHKTSRGLQNLSLFI